VADATGEESEEQQQHQYNTQEVCMSQQTESAIGYLEDLSAGGFWGFITLKFEAGKVVHIRKEENLKPNELPGTNRGRENGSNY
jgi:hypothetical protein